MKVDKENITIGLVLSKPPGYSETFFTSKIEGLKSSGFKVVLFVQKKPSDFSLCEFRIQPKLYKNKIYNILNIIWILIGLLPHLKRVIKFIKLERRSNRSYKRILKNVVTNAHVLKEKLDWLHFGFATLAIQSENIAQAIGSKMAISGRGYDMDVYPLKNPHCYKLLWKKVDKVHVISNYMKQKAISTGMHLDTRLDVITPAIDLARFKISKQTRKSNVLQITTVARLHWIKGLLNTLEALKILKLKGLPFRYKLIGDGPQYGEIVFAIHQLGLKDEVKLLGKQNQAYIINELHQTDLYIQYSESEGFCNAVLEAQALGCICLVSDGGALPENIINNETGAVVQRRNPKVLANEIFNITHMSSTLKTKLRVRARRRLEKEFSLEKQNLKFRNFYTT